MSVDQARQASTAMRPAPFAPPPRTVTDILAILDQAPGTDTQIALRDLADASPPSAGVDALADFYVERGLAAGRIGRARQELDDLHKATEYFLQTVSPVEWIYRILGQAEERDGNYFRYLRYLRMSMRWRPDWQNARLAIGYASIGDVDAAEVFLEETRRYGGDAPNLFRGQYSYAL